MNLLQQTTTYVKNTSQSVSVYWQKLERDRRIIGSVTLGFIGMFLLLFGFHQAIVSLSLSSMPVSLGSVLLGCILTNGSKQSLQRSYRDSL